MTISFIEANLDLHAVATFRETGSVLVDGNYNDNHTSCLPSSMSTGRWRWERAYQWMTQSTRNFRPFMHPDKRNTSWRKRNTYKTPNKLPLYLRATHVSFLATFTKTFWWGEVQYGSLIGNIDIGWVWKRSIEQGNKISLWEHRITSDIENNEGNFQTPVFPLERSWRPRASSNTPCFLNDEDISYIIMRPETLNICNWTSWWNVWCDRSQP